MKKLLILSLLFVCLASQVFSRAYTISDAGNFAGMNITSGDTVTIIGSYTSASSFPMPQHKRLFKITGDWHFTYTGTGKACNFSHLDDFTIEGGEIIAATASSGFELWYSTNATISLKIRDSKWGMRFFYDTNLVVTNSLVMHTWDDNMYAETNKNIEVCYSIFDAANYGYWSQDSTGGDGIQIAGDQGFCKIHHNQFYKFENGWKFGLIMGQSVQDLNDSAIVYNNVFNIRTWQMTATESSTNPLHWVQASSCVYLKPNKSYRFWNNYYYGGANAIFTMTTSTNNRIRLFNETFINQKECIGVGSKWNTRIYNCTFVKGSDTYIKYYGDLVYVTKCIFYGLANPFAGLNGNYISVDNLINPGSVPAGYGANYEYSPVTVQVTDTVYTIDTVPVYYILY